MILFYFCCVKRSTILALTFVLIAQVLVLSAFGQKEVTVEGFISNEKGVRIPLVNIVNTSNRTGTTSNVEGQFRIPSVEGDTIRFSAVGFISKKIIVRSINDSPLLPLHIVLKTDTVQLTGVTIHPWPATADALMKAVLEMEPEANNQPDLHLDRPLKLGESGPSIHPHIDNPLPGMGAIKNASALVTVYSGSPITALYDQFSRRSKSIAKVKELQKFETMHERALVYYSPKIIREITRFKTAEEIEDFMKFCNITDEYVLSHTSYELLCAIRDCYLAYEQRK